MGGVKQTGGVTNQRSPAEVVPEERGGGERVARPAERRPTTAEQRDTVQTGTATRPPDAGTTALERRVAELEAQAKARDDADRVKKEQDAKAAKESGWLKRAVMKLFEFAMRVFFPVVNLISLFARIIQGIKDGKFDWKGIAADAIGAFLPLAMIPLGPLALPLGGLIAGGWDLGNDILNGKDKSRSFGWETDKESGLRVAGRKVKEFGGAMWDGAKKVAGEITGKETERTGRDPGIASDPVTPAEVET